MGCRVGMVSLGCAKNLINSEQMLYLLRENGCEIVTDADSGVDVLIINTCGFIESAKEEAIDAILEAAQDKAAGKVGRIIVAGCLVQRYKDQILEEFPEADAIVGCGSFEQICEAVADVTAGKRPSYLGDINAPLIETERVVSTGEDWAYIKIAEGCDNHCSYCVIPSLRGRFRSRCMEDIVREAEELADMGIRELIVVAQDVTRYGTDLYGRRALPELLERLCRIDGFKWIRLHYLYPDEIDDELIDVIARESKILNYLDIPIQHIDDGVLKLMNRRGTGDEIRALFKKLRERLPGLVLRTSIIAGLPGEGEEEFEELCSFLREAKIERAGVFQYSPEEGSAAAEMERPDEDTARRRTEILMQIQAEVMDEYNRSCIGREFEVLYEGVDEQTGLCFGRSYAESPDVDGRILMRGDPDGRDFVTVRITGETDGELLGEITE